MTSSDSETKSEPDDRIFYCSNCEAMNAVARVEYTGRCENCHEEIEYPPNRIITIRDSILTDSDPALKTIFQAGDPYRPDPDLSPREWVHCLREAARYGICLHLCRERYLDCRMVRSFRLDGQPYPQRLENVGSETAIAVVDEADTVEPVLIDKTSFHEGSDEE